jgi:23S rRNA (uracil1939-C5)-methyltransferase
VTRDATALDIARLGAQGDGIAPVAEGERFVPFALPGERVRETSQGLPEILSPPSPERRQPICKHFGVCGGCVAQHMSDALYAEWKRNIVIDVLRRRGLDAEVMPLQRIPSASRRRVVLTARRARSGIVLGYHRRRSHELFAVEECPVLAPAIALQLAALRAIIAALGIADVRVTVLATPSGLDINLETEKPVAPANIARLVQAAAPQDGTARISVDGETAVARTQPTLDIDDAQIVPPPGTFVQAVAEAEHLMADALLKAMPKAKRVADLFAGIGTFTLRLARRVRVTAIDSDRRAIAALETATRQAQGRKPIEARVRDLFRDPLSPRELDAFDAVVFDPPYAGAKAQAESLARAKVPIVVAVSCNPATLARDLRSLVDGGYRIDQVIPIDQFLYSAHVEVVAILRRSR